MSQEFKDHDFTGSEFPAFHVVGRHGPAEGGNSLWDCICKKCGKPCVIVQSRLKYFKSCGCLLGLAQQDIIDRNRQYSLDGTQINTLLPTRSLNKNSTSKARGVSKMKTGKYRAYIFLRRRQIHLGTFSKIEDAIAAREEAEELYYTPLIELWAEIHKKKPEPRGKYQRKTPPSSFPAGISKNGDRFIARLFVGNLNYYLGSFPALQDAVAARDQALADYCAGNFRPRYSICLDFNLREARERAGLTRKQFAEQLGVTSQSVGCWERGETQIRPERLEQIKEILNIKEDNP